MALFSAGKPRARPRRNPGALAQFKLGRSLAGSGRIEAAAECYRRALELDPEFAEAVVNLGILYGQMGTSHAEDHLACLRRGAELNPGSARAHYNLGVALARRKGSAAEAIAEFERAIAIEPTHRNALYALSQQWSRRGERARAEEFHRRYRAAMGQAEPALGPTLSSFVPAPTAAPRERPAAPAVAEPVTQPAAPILKRREPMAHDSTADIVAPRGEEPAAPGAPPPLGAAPVVPLVSPRRPRPLLRVRFRRHGARRGGI